MLKKTALPEQLSGNSETNHAPEFDEDSSIYDLPPLEPEPYMPMIINVQPQQIADAPAVKPAKLKRHTRVTESLAPELIEFSDDHLAKVWANSDGQDWLYCHGWECWMHWDGSRWAIDRKRSVTNIVSDYLNSAAAWREAGQLSFKDRRSLGGIDKSAKVLRRASSLPTIAMLPEDFDADPFLLGTPDGTIDLRTGQIITPVREHYITRQTAVSPKPMPTPHWDKVIDRCTRGDPEMRKYYQRWAGYILTGDCREEAFLLCMVLEILENQNS